MNRLVAQLPPDCEMVNGVPYHVVKVPADGNRVRIKRTPVAFSIQEARQQGADFYHPVLGWILGGRKTAEENPLEWADRNGTALAGRPWDRPPEYDEAPEGEGSGEEE